MKYFLDTEFLEGPQNQYLFGFKTPIVGPNTIDLISIGIVSEDNREYYAVSKDFNLREAWNRFDLIQQSGDMRNIFPEGKKVYWLREKVLLPIFRELSEIHVLGVGWSDKHFTRKNLAWLIDRYGKSNKDIALEIQEFVYGFAIKGYDENESQKETTEKLISNFKEPVEFYAYFADYDWVVFCWLFGKMIDLPKRFPMYCRDLKQMLDEKDSLNKSNNPSSISISLKNYNSFPKQDASTSHNAIEDARWNKKIYEFLNSLS